MAEEVRIDFKSTADTSGAKQMESAIGGLSGKSQGAAEGLGAASKESKQLAGALGKNVEVGSQAVSMMGQLGNVSKGGAEGLAAAARSGLAFGQMLKGVLAGAGPIGIAVTAITLLGAAVFGLVKAFAAPKESVKDFKDRIAELDKASLKQLDATIAALTDRLKGAKDEADAVRQSLDMVDDAEMGARLAANKESGLDDKEKQRQEILIRDEFKTRKQAREKEAAEQVVDQAREKRDTLSPKFEDDRDRMIDLTRERDRIITLERERDQLQREQKGRGGMDHSYVKAERIRAIDKSIPQGDARAKFEAEYESARDAFQGSDGKGGIAKDYQAAAAEAIAAEKALARLLDTRKKVGEWEKAQMRIENSGVDPRDAEAAARKSPGVARMVGPDGVAREYNVAAAPTINQGLASAADAARAGLPPPATNTLQRGGGSLPGDGAGKDDRIKIDAKPLEKGLKDSADKLKAATDAELAKVAQGVAAQAVALASTAAATTTIATNQVAMQATVQQLQSQVSMLARQ